MTSEEEGEVRGGRDQITISNATVFTIIVETYPIELVRRGNLRFPIRCFVNYPYKLKNLRGYDIAVGVEPAALGGNAKVFFDKHANIIYCSRV